MQMLKENKKTLIITSIVNLLPILIGVIFWDKLPDQMATHFSSGGADGFSGKNFAVFGIPVVMLVLHLIAAFVTANDPRRQNINPKIYRVVLWLIPVISLVVAAMTYSYNLGYDVDISFIVQLFFGTLSVVIGNYLPKARQNYTIGLKFPWTLANEENWNRTHRFGGILWMIGGAAIIVLTLCGVTQFDWTIGILAALALLPFIYSAWLHAAKGL
ncbi:MAG: SdpI family protein [Lachnospiraceae bacterium]|nr:SdpI family protein [Lachnospiraceae bacterium]